MKSLYLRIYLTVVAVLLLFAAVSGWVFQRHLEQERVRVEGLVSDRTAAWGDLLQRALPGAEAPADEQAMAVRDWSQRLRLAYEPYAAAMGLQVGEAKLQGGGSDANLLVALGVPCIDGLGPFGEFFHQVTEWCSLTSLRRRTAALAWFLAEQGAIDPGA
jgi:acetylornithine deacetylase/succinyl-diaminopimelate desuccinylase-like protein